MRVDIRGCARCDQDHPQLEFKKFTTPCAGRTHFAMCPTLQEPIIMKVVDFQEIAKGEPETYMSTWKGGMADGIRTASMSCPKCGGVFSLAAHFIDNQGMVNPSVVCPYKCGYHEFVQLLSWDPMDSDGPASPGEYKPA